MDSGEENASKNCITLTYLFTKRKHSLIKLYKDLATNHCIFNTVLGRCSSENSVLALQ